MRRVWATLTGTQVWAIMTDTQVWAILTGTSQLLCLFACLVLAQAISGVQSRWLNQLILLTVCMCAMRVTGGTESILLAMKAARDWARER